MSRLTSSGRAAIPTGEFALPGRRFPIEDKNHARAALIDVGRAHLSPGQKATVKAKAKAELHVPMGALDAKW